MDRFCAGAVDRGIHFRAVLLAGRCLYVAGVSWAPLQRFYPLDSRHSAALCHGADVVDSAVDFGEISERSVGVGSLHRDLGDGDRGGHLHRQRWVGGRGHDGRDAVGGDVRRNFGITDPEFVGGRWLVRLDG